MSTQLDRLAAYAAAVADQNPTAPVRIRLSDADALALIAEHGTDKLRHPDAATKATAALQAALDAPPPATTDVSGLVAWGKAVEKAQTDFWDAIQGEPINGVEVLRKVS